MARIRIDLLQVYDRGGEPEQELQQAIAAAEEGRVPVVECILGKENAELKKRVLRFLARPEIRQRYYRLEKDGSNIGRVFIHFRHDKSSAYHG
jgi:succinyl-CoA synthetase alpha subunit